MTNFIDHDYYDDDDDFDEYDDDDDDHHCVYNDNDVSVKVLKSCVSFISQPFAFQSPLNQKSTTGFKTKKTQNCPTWKYLSNFDKFFKIVLDSILIFIFVNHDDSDDYHDGDHDYIGDINRNDDDDYDDDDNDDDDDDGDD